VKRQILTQYLRDKSRNAIIDANDVVSPLFLENSKSRRIQMAICFSNATNEEIVSGLNEFVDCYGNWIKLKRLDENIKLFIQALLKRAR
jgi:hypothetical protein